MVQCIGNSIDRIDVRAKVTGEAQYASDLNYPNQLYMKILFAGRPSARVLSIDTTQALALEGIVAVFTAEDVPVNIYGYILNDQPVLCGPGSNNPYGDRVRFVGDQIAVVVAETKELAAEGCKRIVVDYEDLPIVATVEDAMKPDAYLIHPQYDSNIFSTHKIRTGDIDQGFAQADVIVEGHYVTPVQEHAYLETEAGLSYIDEEGRIALIVTGQWAYKDRAQVAHALDLPEDQIRIIYPYIGGAFGGREDISVQIVLGLATYRLHQRGIDRPVKVVWNREESIVGHGKRHPYHIYAKWGATKEGKITAAEVKLIADGGAYQCTTSVVSNVAILNCTGPYEIPNIKVDCQDVYTNTVPRAAFRGFGGPQGAFVAEAQMNKLAEALDLDSVEIRMRNLIKEGSLQSVGAPFPPGVSAQQVVEKCATAGGWLKSNGAWSREDQPQTADTGEPHLKRGVGFACSYKNIGFSHGFRETCELTFELYGGATIEKAILKHNATEVGQGTHTALAQMSAHALGVPIEKIEVRIPDTTEAGDTGSVSASRMTFMAGNAIKEAAEIALERWQNEDRPVIVAHKYLAPPTTAEDPETGHCDPMVSYAYTAEAVEVEVDIDTGHVRLTNLICATDVGKAINPLQVDGQIEGALVQAAGYALLENFIEENGYVKTPNLSTYLIPTVLDIPEKMENIILEYPDPRGPWGARGVGEMPYLALAPAITAAIHSATGVWIDQFPLTPERVLTALGKVDLE
jgi:CO/xanthine dehydrogenase Mo-binding subunit